jgi:diamine N-acetyltransferase
MTVIVGKFCRLRPIRRSDAAISIGWRNDPETRNSVIGYPFPVTEVMEDQWCEQILTDHGGRRASFAIEAKEECIFIGFVHLTEIDWPVRSAKFGVVIGDVSWRRRGIGSEATLLALEYAFKTLNLERIELRVTEPNLRARYIYHKFGFIEEGKLRRAAFLEGNPIDVIIMGLLRGDFKN